MSPYIGITGFMNYEEVAAIISILPESPSRKLMVGVLVSSETLKGQIVTVNPRRYPKIGQVASVFTGCPYVVNLIHYETYEPGTLGEQLIRATELGGPNLHGFQLNHMAWPDVEELRCYHGQCNPARMVMQIGRAALSVAKHSPSEVAIRVGEYTDLLTDVLIDSSEGRGEPLDTVKAREYLEALREKYPRLGLVVAGGLSSTNLRLVESLLPDFPGLSIDAEGRIRNGKDDLDVDEAGRYLQKSLQMFERYQ